MTEHPSLVRPSAETIARRNSPALGCSSKCPETPPTGKQPSSLYCELDAGHEPEDHRAGSLIWKAST